MWIDARARLISLLSQLICFAIESAAIHYGNDSETEVQV